MSSRTIHLEPAGPLAAALPGACFGEHHARVVDAAPEAVWDALQALRIRDLRLTVVLAGLRGLGGPGALGHRLVDPPSPAAPVHEEPPRVSTSGFVAQPWTPVPRRGPAMRDLAALRAFEEPGWLKCGMEWTLSPVAGGRTLVETTTLCEPTDDAARRRFAVYWAVIRPFSGLVRRDVLAALARSVAAE